MPGAYIDLPPRRVRDLPPGPERHRAALDRWCLSWWRAFWWVMAILAAGAAVDWLRHA
jgi:hypothetical protein